MKKVWKKRADVGGVLLFGGAGGYRKLCLIHI